MRSFEIMVDSSCDLTQEQRSKYNITSLPMPFVLNGHEYKDGYWQDISSAEFYDALKNGGLASTTQINPDTFIKTFASYAKQGKELLFIPISGGLSGSCHNAFLALSEVKDIYPNCKIRVVDSQNATTGHGLVAIVAARKGDEGMTLDQTADWLEQKTQSIFAFFTVDDLMYLHRGGRLSKLSAVAGSLLGVKPVLNMAPDGTLKLKDKARGRKNALEMLVNQMKRAVTPGAELDTVTISNSACPEEAGFVASLVRESFKVREVSIETMSPIIGAHVGPGTIAMFFESEMTREEYESKYYSGK